MKKNTWIIIIFALIIIMLIPIKQTYRDGGTVEYSAILYKVIKWNRLRPYEEKKTGTEVYFFPNNLHSLEYYDDIRPDAIAFLDENNEIVVANMGTYSWSKNINGMKQNIIADTFGMEKREFKKVIKVVEGGNVKSDGLISNVTNVNVYKYEGEEFDLIKTKLEYNEENESISVKGLEIGAYILEVLIQEGSNKVCHSIKVQVVSENEISINVKNEELGQTFYAEIKNINNNNLLVDGLDENDINYRGEFSFRITNQTKLEWRNTKIDISDLNKGDRISITFKGEMQETYPVGITDVVRIKLLEDEI